MSYKYPVQPPGAPATDQFPEIPPEDMNNTFFLYEPACLASLRNHFGNSANTIVTSKAPVGWTTRQRQGILVPDLLVSFDANPQALRNALGFSIGDQGKPPDFVLAIGSERTGRRDVTVKRDGYAAFGIGEYWRFDPSGGRFHQAHLAGDRLAEGEYRAVEINRVDEENHWGHSEVLNLDICWERGELRWYDPVGQRYLPTVRRRKSRPDHCRGAAGCCGGSGKGTGGGSPQERRSGAIVVTTELPRAPASQSRQAERGGFGPPLPELQSL